MKKGKRTTLLISRLALLSLFIFLPLLVYGAVPQYISFQGKLVEDGDAITSDRTITFSIWTNSTGGNPASALWQETQSVSITDGIYNVELGTVTPLPVDLYENDDLFLQLDVVHPTAGSQRLSPLMPFNSTVFALKAANAEDAQALEGYGSADFSSVGHGHSGEDITSGIVDEALIDPDIARDSEITWENLVNIPSDIADGDDGITVEIDPTVNPSVKDGVSWGELSGIPFGFADGVDDDSGGDITGVTAGTGLSGGGASGEVSLGLAVPLSLSNDISSGGIITCENTNNTGVGIVGKASGSDGEGVAGTASGLEGTGVFGAATNTGDGVNYGGGFVAAGSQGIGVGGVASNTGDGSNVGGMFMAAASRGVGVYAHATNTGDERNAGGMFIAAGTQGRGVHAAVSGSNGEGVFARASGSEGIGVYGEASHLGDVTNYGGWFVANGTFGIGVHAETLGDNGFAVEGRAIGDNGFGGFFIAEGTQGRGVHGWASDPGDVTNTGGYFMADGSNGRGVYGYATNPGDGVNYGGMFIANGSNGTGVYGYASRAGDVTNYGGLFFSNGNSGFGVYASSQNWDIYAGGTGYMGPFTGAHEVILADGFPNEVKPGMIVSVTGKTHTKKENDGIISISSTLPTVALSSIENDKRVFGALVSEASLHANHWYEGKDKGRFATVNALGEGRVWVSNIHGDIEAGDYITTSAIPGYGQRQDDDLLHSYTLGKAIETLDWDLVTETLDLNGQTFKIYLIAVVYTSG